MIGVAETVPWEWNENVGDGWVNVEVELWAQLVLLKLGDEEDLQVDWVANFLGQEMEMEKVLGLGLVVVEVVPSPSSAVLEVREEMRSGRP